MSDTSYVFDRNTLTLFNTWGNIPLSQLSQGPYADIINDLTDSQKNQYNFWLSLPASQKQFIRDEIYNFRGPIVANVRLYNVRYLNLNQIANLLSTNQISSFKVLDDEYVQLSDINGNIYIVNARYDPQTNKIFPHS